MASQQAQTATEDYLKVIFKLGEWDQGAQSNADIAAALGVTTSSASEMIRKLADQGLVDHERYGPVVLTGKGRTIAVEMVRRHRLVETYLVQALGYSWDEVHEEAEVLEHAVSAKLIDRMDAMLGRPSRDPHGDPIPTPEGVVHQPVARPLASVQVGDGGYIARIGDEDSALLRWLEEHGVTLDAQVSVTEVKPFGGPTVVSVNGVGTQSASVELGPMAIVALWVADRPPRSSEAVSPRMCPYVRCRHIG